MEFFYFLVVLLLASGVAGSGLWQAGYGGPWISRNYYPSYDTFNTVYGAGGGLDNGWNHLNDHNYDQANGYAEGDHDDWSNLSYGGHKSRASGNTYSQNYAHDSGNDFGHDNSFNNGFDHGHNVYESHHAPAWNDYRAPYHYE